jgi:RND family efflux transporter MFP subunit
VKLPHAKVVLPALVLVAAGVLATVLVTARATVETRPPEALPPLVRVLAVEPEDIQLHVDAQGSVVPRTESELVPEVSGRVLWVSPALAAGGFFEAGDPLLRLDPADYQVALARAKAAAEGARSQAQLARRNAERSRELARDGLASRVSLDDAENAARVAAATERETEAALQQAERDLGRTEITAPYAGRVREENVDIGQFVERGRAVARIYAVDFAEVRLPVSDADVAFLDLALGYRGETQEATGPEVVLRATFAGEKREWHGRIVRTEGEIDPRSRMVHAVARVEDPYGRGPDGDRPPLAVGLFVDAEILGRQVPSAVVLPRAALRGGNDVLVVDADDRLRRRPVEVVRIEHDGVVIGGGLRPGERVCVSPLETFVEGMKVRTVAEQS